MFYPVVMQQRAARRRLARSSLLNFLPDVILASKLIAKRCSSIIQTLRSISVRDLVRSTRSAPHLARSVVRTSAVRAANLLRSVRTSAALQPSTVARGVRELARGLPDRWGRLRRRILRPRNWPRHGGLPRELLVLMVFHRLVLLYLWFFVWLQSERIAAFALQSASARNGTEVEEVSSGASAGVLANSTTAHDPTPWKSYYNILLRFLCAMYATSALQTFARDARNLWRYLWGSEDELAQAENIFVAAIQVANCSVVCITVGPCCTDPADLDCPSGFWIEVRSKNRICNGEVQLQSDDVVSDIMPIIGKILRVHVSVFFIFRNSQFIEFDMQQMWDAPAPATITEAHQQRQWRLVQRHIDGGTMPCAAPAA